MITRMSVLAAALMAGIAIPQVSAPAFAQDQQAVRDALGRAQQGAERRAVEDLINRLRGTPAQASPAVPGTTPTAAPAPGATASPLPTAVPIPPASSTPPAQPAAAAQTAAPAAGAAPPPAATTQPAPASAPATGATARPSTAAPAGAPKIVAAPPRGPLAGPPISPPTSIAATPNVAVPRGGDIMAKAPEIAEKMGLPSADIEVYFGFNSAEITPQAMNTLVVMGQALADPQLAGQRFIIGGHTDGKGRPDFNLALSKRRAEAVRKFVIEHYQIEPARLIARGYGKSRPKNAGMPLADENRRVQVINWTRMVASAKPPR